MLALRYDALASALTRWLMKEVSMGEKVDKRGGLPTSGRAAAEKKAAKKTAKKVAKKR